eukprot:4123588-Prymnesium_polylepis.1
MLPAPCRCAPRAEEAKIFAGPHVWLCLSCVLSKYDSCVLNGTGPGPYVVSRVVQLARVTCRVA